MFEPGNIVYHDKLVFNDRKVDNKKKRPCVVLFSKTIDDKEYICTCPLTSKIKTFNRFPKKYCLIKEVVHNYRKLSFASISNISLKEEKNTHYTNENVDKTTVDSIRNKLKEYNGKNKEYLIIKEYLEEVEQEEKRIANEEKIKRKALRKALRKASKSNC